MNSIPNQVYESYLAAIWDDFWILDAEKHMIKTLDDLVSVVSIVKKHCRSQKEELLQKLISFAKEHGKDTNSDKVIHMLSEVPRSSLTALQNTASLELAVKVWLLADFQMYAKRVGERTRRDWALGESLCNQIRKSIRDDSEFDISSDLSIRRRFSPRFNLYDMDRLTLVQIKWTNNIAKHLYLEEDRRFVHTVHIFSHTTLMHTVAQELRQSSHVGNDTESDLAKLLLETMDTLDLLLDLHDSECQNWYRKLRKKDNKQRQKENRPTGGLDENAGTPKRPGSLAPSDVDELRRVGHYDFWQPRLLKLETAFKESKPRAIGGWWRDKRDRGIWATFIGSFLAILIAVFAIVVAIGSIVTGSMSVELAEDANKMAAKGLDKDTVAPLTISNAGGPPLTTVTVQSCCSCTLCDMSGPRSNGSVTETRVIEQVAESTPCT